MDRFRLSFVLLLAIGLGGCSFDLFHDTSWETACDIDPTTPGCSADASSADAGRDAKDGASGDVGLDGDGAGAQGD